ncbi:MAG: YggN family protein [Gemmatimonadales bacterium]|nr:YggN family protein [Gemmatimonadales bacterium]
MRTRQFFPFTLMLILITAGSSLAGHLQIDNDNLHLDFEGSTLVVDNDSRPGGIVEITAQLELYVDGKEIQTDRKDRKVLEAYYEKAEKIEEAARELGVVGARLGVHGAALGISAIGKVLRLLSPDYDVDDLEEEIEEEAESIEFAAEGIEEAAEELEEWVQELQDIGDELQGRIPELADLDWF